MSDADGCRFAVCDVVRQTNVESIQTATDMGKSMSNQIDVRDQLFATMAVEWKFLDPVKHRQILETSASSSERSLPELVIEWGDLSDNDCAALYWMVDRRLETEQPAPTDASFDSTRSGLGVDTDSRNSPEFLSTHIQHATETTTPPKFATEAERYHRRNFHAKGGIGQVWLTRDVNFERDVALKELLPTRRGEQYLRRFLLEARVTARLEHPGIVPVYGLHLDEDAGPFYTMRFIQGKTLREAIHEYHEKKTDDVTSTLELANLLNSFIAICNTIEFAHSKGVIHRDLKGQNIAIGEFGEVIVLDWGLAKVMGDAEADDSHTPNDEASGFDTTQAGTVVGTPAFMSPEQATADNDQVGPRSDIYSLGVILFEVLTGKLPFKADDVSSLLNKVATETAPRPSQLSPSVPKPLEAICLKAIEKQSEKRYASARDLGDDIRRYLADETVSALPDSIITQIGRWGRRNRTKVATVASVLVALIVALTGGAILLADANSRVNDQWLRSEHNAEQATVNFEHAVKSVNNFYTLVSENQLLDVPGMVPLRDELLQNALDYYSEFAAQDADNPVLKGMLADACFRMARIRIQLGKNDEAMSDLKRCQQLHQSLSSSGFGSELGTVSYAKVIGAMCAVEMQRGNHDASQEQRLEAIRVLEEFVKAHPKDAAGNEELAQVLTDQSRYFFETRNLNEAMPPAIRAMVIRRTAVSDNPDRELNRLFLAELLSFYGVLQRDSGDAKGAEQTFAESIELYEGLGDEVATLVRHRSGAAGCYQSYGALLRHLGNPTLAEQTLNSATEIREELVREFPSVPEHRSSLALSHTSLGVLHWNLRDSEKALPSFKAAVKINKRLTEDFPQTFIFQDDLAAGYNNLAMVYRTQQEFTEAYENYLRCIDIRTRLLDQSSNAVQVGVRLAGCYDNVGRLFRFQNDFKTSLKWQEKSVSQLEQIIDRIGEDPRVVYQLHRAYRGRAESLDGLGRFADSANDWQKSADLEKGNDHQFLLMKRARALVRASDVVTGTKEAALLLSSGTLDSETIFNAAGVFALAIADVKNDTKITEESRQKQQAEFLRQAIEALEQARKAGYFDNDAGLDDLNTNDDLSTMRDSAAFKQFVSNLTAAASKP